MAYARRCGGRARLVALDEAAGYLVPLLQSKAQRHNGTLYQVWSEISELSGDTKGAAVHMQEAGKIHFNKGSHAEACATFEKATSHAQPCPAR